MSDKDSYSKSTSERDWVDNQASIIGTNSVTINVGDNTNLVGSVIANVSNASSLRGAKGDAAIHLNDNAIDGGNLTLNTNSLTFTNLLDNDQARSFGIGLGGNGRWKGSAITDAKGSGSLSLDYSMHDFEQTTSATIGLARPGLSPLAK